MIQNPVTKTIYSKTLIHFLKAYFFPRVVKTLSLTSVFNSDPKILQIPLEGGASHKKLMLRNILSLLMIPFPSLYNAFFLLLTNPHLSQCSCGVLNFHRKRITSPTILLETISWRGYWWLPGAYQWLLVFIGIIVHTFSFTGRWSRPNHISSSEITADTKTHRKHFCSFILSG